MKFLVLLALCGIAFGLEGIVPLRKIQSLREKMMEDGRWPAYREAYERYRDAVLATGNEPMKDYSDESYVADVDIGTPAQHFNVIMDTGSANLWVPGTDCTTTGPCAGKNEFNPSKSSTYVKTTQTFSIQYGTGSCSGYIVEDTVSIAGISVTKQQWGEATKLASFFENQPMDGICGLAFQALAADRILPPVQNMINQKMLNNPWFTVWLTAKGGSASGVTGGQLTLGNYDTTHCSSSCSWVPLSSATYYQFVMTQVTAGTYKSSTNWQVISDTGTSLIAGPKTQIDGIGQALGGTYNSLQGLYAIDCGKESSLAPVVFTINGNTYSVEAKNYVIQSGTKCYLGFQAFSSGATGPSWILGDCFIREYCNVYDMGNKRVGLCKATQ